MKKSTVIRLICIMLVFLMLAPFTACVNDVNTGDTNDSSDSTDVTTEIVTTAGTEEVTQFGTLPEDISLDQKEVSILYWNDVNNMEFDIPDDEYDRIATAIRDKDNYVQRLLGVTVNWNGEPGSKSKLEGFKTRVEVDVKANEAEIIAGHSMVVGALAAAGLLQDLTQTQYLDFENPWWPSDLIQNSTIKGKLFFASGDISNNTLLGMLGMFFNKSMVKNDLYKVVTSKEWTLDRFIAETENMYVDAGGGVKDNEDTYGYTSYSGMINPIFVGSGIRIIDKNDKGELKLSDTYVTEKTHSLLEKINNCFYTDNDWKYCSKIDECTDMFKSSRAAFYMASVRLTINDLTDSDITYGILPTPKYNLAQEDYFTLMANTYTMYAITKNVANTDAASAVIEAMAQEGYRTVTPEVFEVALKARYSDAPDDAVMFDILRNTTVFEIGLIFSDQISKIPSTALFTLVNNKSSDWISYMKDKESRIAGNLSDLNKAFS